MGRITFHYLDNPLSYKGARHESAPAVGTVEEGARQAFPDLDVSEWVFVRGGREVEACAAVADGDHFVCARRIAGPVAAITAAEVGRWVVQALVYAAVSYLISYLLRPKDRKNKAASPAYNVNLDQNAARLGGTLPVIYGRVLAVPDIAAQPYSEFIDHNEEVGIILCLGMGRYQINDIYVGESRMQDFPSGSVTAWVFGPDDHRQTLGVIEQATGIVEDMMTVPESAGVDIAAPNDPAELTITGTVSGSTLTPTGDTAATIWSGLVPGRQYLIATSDNVSTVTTYVGVGPNNSAVFSSALPIPGGTSVLNITAQLITASDVREGPVMLLYANANIPQVQVGDMIQVEANGVTSGPFQIYKFTVGTTRAWLRTHGPGFVSQNNATIYPTQAVRVLRNATVVYSITEYTAGSGAYRWRGWYALPRAQVQVNRIFFDIVLPNGLAWVTDSGGYNQEEVTFQFQIQQVDDDSNPIGGVSTYTQTIRAATSTPRRVTYAFNVSPGRYRVRLARTNTRDQRASKEISAATLSAIRGRIYHAAGTPAYEGCTLIAMRFRASAGLAAAANRRIKVDATRMLPDLNGDGMYPTSNPARAVRDAYTNTIYGAGRPTSEFDGPTYWRLEQQWAQTNGFNAVFDQQTTAIEAMQAMLAPVRAIPLPIGSLLSAAQDAPRPRSFVFGPETLVAGTLSQGYNFDGLDQPDCLEVLYNDPRTFAEARIFYPAQGIKPDTIELFGVTSKQQATDWARLAWQERQTNRKTCQFELEGEGYLLDPLTRFAIAIPAIDRGAGGIVLAVSGNSVEVDTPIPASQPYIQFKQWDGTLGAPILIASRQSDYIVTLASAVPADVKTSDQFGDATRWIAGNVAGLLFEYAVTNLEASGPMRVRVTGTQYTDAKYSGTFVEHWSP